MRILTSIGVLESRLCAVMLQNRAQLGLCVIISFSKPPFSSMYSTISMTTTAFPLRAGTTVIKESCWSFFFFFTAASCYRVMLGLVSGLLFFKMRAIREPVISAGFFNQRKPKLSGRNVFI